MGYCCITLTSCSAGKVQCSPEAETCSLCGFVLIERPAAPSASALSALSGSDSTFHEIYHEALTPYQNPLHACRSLEHELVVDRDDLREMPHLGCEEKQPGVVFFLLHSPTRSLM